MVPTEGISASAQQYRTIESRLKPLDQSRISFKTEHISKIDLKLLLHPLAVYLVVLQRSHTAWS